MLGWLWQMFGYVPEMHGDEVRQRVLRVPTTSIKQVSEGNAAHIVGIVEAQAVTYAPFTNRPCAAWVISVFETGATEQRFAGALDSRNSISVRDSTGYAIVMLDDVMIAWPGVIGGYHPHGPRVRTRWTPTQRDAFDRAQVRLNYPSSSGVRFYEHVIVSGAQIHVLGHAHHEPDRDSVDPEVALYRGDMPTRPVFARSKRTPLLISSTIRM